jgi:nucleoid-associated protein YgaU
MKEATAMRQRLRDTAVGLAAVVGLAAWLVGVPLLLWTWRHNPLPTRLPSWHRLTTLIDGGYLDPDVIPNATAVIAWLAWAWVTRSIVLDTSARLRHCPAPAPRTTGPLQLAVGRWVTAATLVAALFTQRPNPARAAAPPPLLGLAPAGHTLVLDGPTGPSTGTTAAPAVSGADERAAPSHGGAEYEVQRGDSYWRIAEHYTGSGNRWRELRDLNVGRLHVNGAPFTADSKLIHPGDHLLLPAAWPAAATSSSEPAATGAPAVHVVKRGENLSRIAAEELGDPDRWPEIYRLNRDQIGDPDLVYAGQALRLPVPGPTAHPAPAAPSEPAPPPEPLPPPVPFVPSSPPPTTPSPALPAEPMTTAEPPVRRTPATTSTADPSTKPAHESPGSNVPMAPVLAGLGAVTGAVVLWQLRRQQAFALLRRRPHRDLKPRSPAARNVEALLVGLADTELIDWLDATQRALHAQLTGIQEPGRVIAMRAGTHGVEVLWNTRRTAPPPWTVDDTGTWRLTASTTVDDLRVLGADHGPICPAAVTIGDTIDGPLLVDLETAGTVAVDCDIEVADRVLAAVLIELAISPWAVDVDLRVYGAPPEITRLDRVQSITLDDINRLATRTAARHPPNGAGSRGLRLDLSDEERSLTVLVAFDFLDLAPFRSWLTPGSPAGLVVVSAAHHLGPLPHGLTLTVADDLSGDISPLGFELTRVNALDRTTCDAVVELVAEPPPERAEESAPVIGSASTARESSVHDTIGAVLAARSVEVRILTPTPTVTGWQTPPPGQIATELIVFFATRDRPITPARARALLYPDGITSEAWRAALSRTRRALGADPETGIDHLPTADNGHLATSETVGCDWHRFQTLRRLADQYSGSARAELLRAALALIDGPPFTAVPTRRYRWVDEPSDYLRQQLIVAVHDTATDLAELALADLDDPALALDGVRAGLGGGGDNEHLYRLAFRAHLARGDTPEADAVIRGLERAVTQHDGLVELQPETLALIEHWSRAGIAGSSDCDKPASRR